MANIKTFFALECNLASVKLVEMHYSAGKFQLVSAESVPVSGSQGSTDLESSWKEAIQTLVRGKNLESGIRFLSVNDPMTSFAQFVIPRVPKKEMTEILKWKLKDEIPFPLEEALLDYRFFELPKLAKEAQRSVLASAAPRLSIDLFAKILAELNLPNFIPVTTIFTVGGLTQTFDLNTRQMVAVIDINESITEIALYAKGRLVFLRKIGFGNASLNNALTQPLTSEQGRMQLTLEEVEKIKKGVDLLDSESSEPVLNRFSISKLHALIRPELEKLVVELRRSFDYYTELQGEGMERIFL